MINLNVAMIQHNCSTPNQRLNTEIGLNYVREAKNLGADIVLFPECWITSYSCPDIADKLPPEEVIEQDPEFICWCENALTEASEALKKFCDLAKELSIGIVITGFTKGKKYPQNTAFVIDRDGQIILKYSKVHTCDFGWERYLESGDGFHVCRFDGICIGLMICYDREYPESARELMLQGAEIILVPNDCQSMKPRLQELSVRAMENMVGIAMANPPGKNAGCSCAYSPIVWDKEGIPVDNTIVIADEMEEGIIPAVFSMDKIREYRRREDLGKYRKVKAYKRLTN
jgi:predicted amidohydrolase